MDGVSNAGRGCVGGVLLLAGGGDYEGVQRWVNGLANGTNPDHEEFWGNMKNKDQRMVECSAIGFSLAVAKSKLWDPLPDEGKRSLENWPGGMNDKEMPNTNWLWFRVSHWSCPISHMRC